MQMTTVLAAGGPLGAGGDGMCGQLNSSQLSAATRCEFYMNRHPMVMVEGSAVPRASRPRPCPSPM
eukprot:3211615-Prymnesium_polylepis.1